MAWVEHTSRSSGATYWYNTATGASSWVAPGGAAAAPAAKRARTSTSTAEADASGPGLREPPAPSSHAKASAATESLPDPHIIEEHPESTESKWLRADLVVNPTLSSIFTTETVTDATGASHKFMDGVNPIEGRHLYNLVKENGFTRTAEVGCAMGTSALYICQAFADNGFKSALHTAVDPNQDTQYKSIGRNHVKRAGLESTFALMHEPSYLALPRLVDDVKSGKIPKLQFVFIDGWHTFDYTLVDFFYADLMLEINGIICVDDIRHKSVTKCIKYIRTNYPNYRLVEKTPCSDTLATFVKTADDSREWNAHKNF